MKYLIDLAPLLFFALLWCFSIVNLRRYQKKNFVYLLLFTLFYIYIYKVLDYTLFQFQSLLLLKHFMPGLMLNGLSIDKSINIIPLINLTGADLKTSLLNILLFIPFGFGLPFISSFRFKKILISGLLFSILIEVIQLLTGLISKMTFRVTDINDVIFNTIGVVVGYLFFITLLQCYKLIYRNKKISNLNL